MGMSFYDENSLMDRVGSLAFVSTSTYSNSIPDSGSVDDQESPGENLEDIEI